MINISQKDINDYKETLKNLIIKYSHDDYQKEDSIYFLLKQVMNTKVCEVIKKNLEGNCFNSKEELISKELNALLDNRFKKEMLLIWLEKFNLEFFLYENHISQGVFIRKPLANLNYVGIGEFTLISDDLNKKIESIVNQEKIGLKNKNEIDFVTLIYYGFYINKDILICAEQNDNNIKNGVIKNSFKILDFDISENEKNFNKKLKLEMLIKNKKERKIKI